MHRVISIHMLCVGWLFMGIPGSRFICLNRLGASSRKTHRLSPPCVPSLHFDSRTPWINLIMQCWKGSWIPFLKSCPPYACRIRYRLVFFASNGFLYDLIPCWWGVFLVFFSSPEALHNTDWFWATLGVLAALGLLYCIGFCTTVVPVKNFAGRMLSALTRQSRGKVASTPDDGEAIKVNMDSKSVQA